MKERKRKITTITIIGIMLILAITTFTYAIWSRTHIQTGINKNTYACFDISYEETNGQGITMENGFPQKDEQGMQNDPYEVQIENTCDTVTSYNVILNKEHSSDLADEHLKIAVDNDYKLLSAATQTAKRTIQDFTNEASYIIGTGVVGPKQTKTVQIRSWMDEKTSEQDGENKSFTFKITIENVVGINGEIPLKDMILAAQPINDEITDFSFVLSDWKEKEVNIDASKGICVVQDYNDIEWNEIDYFTFYNKGVCNVKDVENYVNWYTFGNDMQNSSSGIYRIKEVNETTITKVDYQTYVPKEKDGLVKAQDDDGTSYIYRGVINNNYISFANKLWRIVRINGDGSIRIIADEQIGKSKFNNEYQGQKYVGYTYDNSEHCTNDNPCKSEYNGSATFKKSNDWVDSVVKTYLENWYYENLKENDDEIVLTTFCNDTTIGNTYSWGITYGAGERIEKNNTAMLKCPDTDKDYGGVYKLKIGLITADELLYAAIPYRPIDAIKGNYLLHNYQWWTMTPAAISNNETYIYYGYGTSSEDDYATDLFEIYPVINLKSDVTVTGAGTQDNPYVVQ